MNNNNRWLVPFLTWNGFMGLAIYVHHTHPMIPWVEREEEWSYLASQVFGTVHVLKPGLSWFDEAVNAAFDKSDELVLEMEMPRTNQTVVGRRAPAKRRDQ